MNKCYFILLLSVLCVCCSPTNKTSNEINIYSQRHYSVDEIQYKNFEKLTGIKVNVVKANADELIERLKNEGENTPADLFITVDAMSAIDLPFSFRLTANAPKS